MWSLDIYSVEETGTREEEKSGYKELSFDNEVQDELKGLSIEELKSVSDELTSQTGG